MTTFTQSPEIRNNEQKQMLRAGYLAHVTGQPDPFALHQLVVAIKSWRARNAEKALMAQRMDAAFGRPVPSQLVDPS